MRPQGIDRIEMRMQEIITRFSPPRTEANLQTGEQESNKPIEEGTGSRASKQRQNPDARHFKNWLQNEIQQNSSKYGVSTDLIQAVMKAESGGNPNAISPKGAMGLMQLMPETAKELGVDPNNPPDNLEGGVRYLRKLAGQFQSLDEVLAAYNAGPGTVQKYGGVPPYPETENYIKKIRQYLDDSEPRKGERFSVQAQ